MSKETTNKWIMTFYVKFNLIYVLCDQNIKLNQMKLQIVCVENIYILYLALFQAVYLLDLRELLYIKAMNTNIVEFHQSLINEVNK